MVGFFCLFFGINQLDFDLLHFRDIIIDTYYLYQSFFRGIMRHHNIHPHPIPFGEIRNFGILHFLCCLVYTDFTTKTFTTSFYYLLIEIKNLFTIVGMYFTIHTYNICQRSILFLTHVLKPLLYSISLLIKKIELRIAYFSIIRNQKEEIFKILYLFDSIQLLGVIHIQKYIPEKLTILAKELTHLGIESYISFSFRFIIFSYTGKRIIHTKIQLFFIAHPFSDFLRYIRVIKYVNTQYICFVTNPEYFHVFIINIDHETILIIDFYTNRNISKDYTQELFTTVQCLVCLFSLCYINKECHYLIFFRRINNTTAIFTGYRKRYF